MILHYFSYYFYKMAEEELLRNYYYDFSLDRAVTIARIIGVETFAGLSILDIGCGSAQSSTEEHVETDMFAGLFVLACHKLGAEDIVGVDLFEQDPRLQGIYTHVRGNFVTQPLSVLVTDQKFDIINIHQVFGRPNPSGILLCNLPAEVAIAHVRQKLMREAILQANPNCHLVMEESVFRLGEDKWLRKEDEIW